MSHNTTNPSLLNNKSVPSQQQIRPLMATNPSLFKRYSPSNTWPVGVLKGLKGKRKKRAEKQKTATMWPRWGRVYAPEGRGRRLGNPRLSAPYRRLRGRRKRVIRVSRRIHPWRPVSGARDAYRAVEHQREGVQTVLAPLYWTREVI